MASYAAQISRFLWTRATKCLGKLTADIDAGLQSFGDRRVLSNSVTPLQIASADPADRRRLAWVKGVAVGDWVRIFIRSDRAVGDIAAHPT
jgi:hypothetical protein